MVPGNHLLRFDEDNYALCSLDRYCLAGTIIQGTGVALPDGLAHALDNCAVVADDCMSLELDAAQFVISLLKQDASASQRRG